MKKLLLMFTLIFMVTSCDDNMSYMEEMTDLQLIEAIANDPNKFEVDGVDIPQASQFVVAAEYYDYMLISAEISPEHGYLISMGDMALDAIGLLAKPFMDNGGTLIGRWPTEGYEFDISLAQDGDDFLGLGLDNDNEEELTEERLIIWAELIKDEFGI